MYEMKLKHLHHGSKLGMATNEAPPQHKRNVVEETTPSVIEETTRTLYVLEEGRYVPVNKGSDGAYVSPPACDSDEDVDHVLEEEYNRQLRESDCFDCNVYVPNGSVIPYICYDHHEDEIGICARGSNFQLLRLEKYNVMFNGLVTYFITAEVTDPATNSTFAFQTCVNQCTCKRNEDFRIETELCRLKPEPQGSEAEVEGCHWNSEVVDDFYKGDLKWLPDDALVQSDDKRHQFYEVRA
ncbi:UPF0725 protein At4g29550 [Capsella rubella]|uniref:UPF0725 protein At4g29550 n=1 Tax=Capsella rubella TaxID=81985 RepID=UPI000CD54CFA|nr:UPF0725 protein At4g29550 [Capsella rubella]